MGIQTGVGSHDPDYTYSLFVLLVFTTSAVIIAANY